MSIFFTILFLFIKPNVFAEEIYDERLSLYKKVETMTNVPWYYLAAFDQYERNIQKDKQEELISISFPEEVWYGMGNIYSDEKIETITFFNGMGRDGNGDGKAKLNDPEDTLYTAANLLLQNGLTEDDIKISLWRYYQRDLSVKTMVNIAK